MEKLLTLLLGIILLTIRSSQSETPREDGRFVCYYASWSAFRTPESRIYSSEINPTVCTHLVYAFALIDEKKNTIAPSDPELEINQHRYADFVNLKKSNKNLSCLIAIGGSAAGSGQFSAIASTPQGRAEFAKNLLEFLRKYGFDGVNVDWQFPGDYSKNSSKEDLENYVIFLKEIEEAFKVEAAKSGKAKLMLSTSIPGKIKIIQEGYDLQEILKYVEFMNVLSYDYHFSTEESTGHHSPLYSLPPNEKDNMNADAAISYLLSKGVPAKKLNLGVPLYGRSFTLTDPKNNALGAPATGSSEQPDGFYTYYEICKLLKDGWTVERVNATAMGPYAYKDRNWIGYDDQESARLKGEYAKKKGLGGLSFWSLDEDDFNGGCGTESYPIINSAKSGYQKV